MCQFVLLGAGYFLATQATQLAQQYALITGRYPRKILERRLIWLEELLAIQRIKLYFRPATYDVKFLFNAQRSLLSTDTARTPCISTKIQIWRK